MKKIQKNLRKAFTLFELIFVILMLSAIGVGGWVVFHFISKFW